MRLFLSLMIFCLPLSCLASQTLKISDIQWRLKDSTLYISGEGDLPSNPDKYLIPWNGEKMSVAKLVITGNIKTIGSNFFETYEYPALRSIDMSSSSVERIEKLAFCMFRHLKEVHFSDSLKIIEGHAFDHTGLRRVVLPPYAHCSGGVFHNCFALEYLSFPDSLRTTQMISAQTSYIDTFEVQLSPVTDTIIPFTIGVLNVNHIEIPPSVRYIADSAFYYRYDERDRRQVMKKIYMRFSEQQILSMSWGPRWAEGLKKDVVIFVVPKGLKNIYEAFINRKYNYNFVIEESEW